jgi:hypothetical protein
MKVQLTVRSASELVLHLVSDYAKGLGYAVGDGEAFTPRGVRITMPDVEQGLVELLTHVALSATKAGVDVGEPLCEVVCHHGGASSDVRLALRLTELRIDAAAADGA